MNAPLLVTRVSPPTAGSSAVVGPIETAALRTRLRVSRRRRRRRGRRSGEAVRPALAAAVQQQPLALLQVPRVVSGRCWAHLCKEEALHQSSLEMPTGLRMDLQYSTVQYRGTHTLVCQTFVSALQCWHDFEQCLATPNYANAINYASDIKRDFQHKMLLGRRGKKSLTAVSTTKLRSFHTQATCLYSLKCEKDSEEHCLDFSPLLQNYCRFSPEVSKKEGGTKFGRQEKQQLMIFRDTKLEF